MDRTHPLAVASHNSNPQSCVTCSDQAIPARVLEVLPDDMARVEMDGATEEVNISLVNAVPGDTVFVHADVAIARLTRHQGVSESDGEESRE